MASPNVIGKDIEIYRQDDNYGTKYRIKFCVKKNDYWLNEFMQIQLPMGTDLPTKTKINILEGYITFFPSKNGNQYKIVCTKFEISDNSPIGDIDFDKNSDTNDDNFLW